MDKRAALEQMMRSGADPESLRAFVAGMTPKDRKAIARSIPTVATSAKPIPSVPIPSPAVDTIRGWETPAYGKVHVSTAPTPAKKRPRSTTGGEHGKDCSTTTAPRAQPVWEVATDWQFTDEVTQKIPFSKELWKMMAIFGDPRGDFLCVCPGRGENICSCLDTVVFMEAMLRKFAKELLQVCQDWSGTPLFGTKHLHLVLPGECKRGGALDTVDTRERQEQGKMIVE
ncbi:unnamed protein product [Discosporangium mesarthrocarpum]